MLFRRSLSSFSIFGEKKSSVVFADLVSVANPREGVSKSDGNEENKRKKIRGKREKGEERERKKN